MRAIFLGIVSLLCIQLGFANTNLENTLVTAIKDNHLDTAVVAVKILDAKSGTTLLAFNSGKNMIPASSVKLLTAASALIDLGEDYRYKTGLYYDNKSHQNIDNLYIDLSGDPSLTSKELSNLLQSLVKNNIQTIAGNIYHAMFNFFRSKLVGRYCIA